MPIQMPDRESRVYRDPGEIPTTLAERLDAQISLAAEENPIPLLERYRTLKAAQSTGDLLTKPQAESIAQEQGVSLDLPETGTTSTALQIQIQRAKERSARQSVIDRSQQSVGATTLGFGTELAVGLLDPVGLAVNFVPIVGGGTRIAKMAQSANALTRIGGRTAVGAIEGAVGQAMIEPFVGGVARMEGQAYGWEDAARNVAFGTVLGASAHNILGGGGDLWRAFSGESQPWTIPGTTPVTPDIAAAMAEGAPSPLPLSGTVYGGATRIKMGDRYIPGQWAVVEADELSPTTGLADNQFRDRTRVAAEEQVRNIANNIDFEYLANHPDMSSGAPTLARSGEIIGGNGRSQAIRMAYDLESRPNYEAPLRSRLQEWGINPEAVAEMKKPVLVRLLNEDVDVRAAAIASNESGVLKMSALEQAKVDSERLAKGRGIEVTEDGRLDSAGNRQAIRDWVEKFPESERASLMDKAGGLSAEGLQRFRNAILHQAYGDSPTLARLIESDPTSALGRVASSLLRVAGKIAEAKGQIARGEIHDLDISGDLSAAVERMAWLREQGMPVEDYLAQTDLLGTGLSPEATAILGYLGRNSDSAARMAAGIEGYYKALQDAGDPAQGSLFGEAPDKAAMLDLALSAAENDTSTARAKMERVSPATRDAAMGVASMQTLQGMDIRVDPIVNSDPAIGTATAADAVALAKDADNLEFDRTADLDAWSDIEQTAATPVRADIEAARTARDEARAELDRLEADLENAWKYSLSERGGKLTPEAVNESIVASFGKSGAAMVKAGNIEVVGTIDDLPPRPNGDPHPINVQGLTTPDGKVYIVAANVESPQALRGLILHEVGAHVGMREMLGDQGFADVLDQVDRLMNSGDPIAMRARAIVPANTVPELIREETLAYLVQEHPELPLVQRVIAAVRAWAYKNFQFVRNKIELTAADLQALAVSAVRNASGTRAASEAYSAATPPLPENIDVDGVQRSTLNSEGRPIHPTEEGVRNFWRWFGDSKVVDAKGRPLVVYHGGAEEVNSFSRGAYRGDLGAAYFSGSPRTAMQYAIAGGSPQRGETLPDLLRLMKQKFPDRTPNVTRANLSIKNPADITSERVFSEIFDTYSPAEIQEITRGTWIGDHLDRIRDDYEFDSIDDVIQYARDNASKFSAPTGSYDDLAVGESPAFSFLATTGKIDDFMEKRGYDGFIFDDNETGGKTFIPRSATQIKSATGNRGTFDPSNPDIRYSLATDPVPDRAGLRIFEEAEQQAERYAGAARAAAERIGDDAGMLSAILASGGGEITKKEAENLRTVLKQRHRQILSGLRKLGQSANAQNIVDAEQQAALAAADQIADQELRAAAVEHRNAILRLGAKHRAVSFVKSQFKGDEFEGLKALVGGTIHRSIGGRDSAELAIKGFQRKWMSGLLTGLEKRGVSRELFLQDAHADDVAKALWEFSQESRQKAPNLEGLHPDAVKIAEVIHATQEDARQTRNRFGAWIGDLRGWMFRQGHDMDKMRSAGFEAWRDFVRDRIDWARHIDAMPEAERTTFSQDDFLRSAYDALSTGQHLTGEPEIDIRPQVGPASLAKKVSQSRVLHFQSAADGMAYMRKFGPGNGSLAETIQNDIMKASREAGLMKTLGPNYQATLESIIDQVAADLRGTPSGDKIFRRKKEILDVLHFVDGQASIPHSALGAKVGGYLRAWESMSKLGAALISQVSDIPVYGASLSRTFGGTILDGMRDAIGGIVRGRAKGEQREILEACGYYYESLSRGAVARFQLDDIPGNMTRAMETFFRWGGITWWTETLRSSAVLTVSHRLGAIHGAEWGSILPDTRAMLEWYKIDAGKWDLYRKAATMEADGKPYLTPEGVAAIPDAALASYATSVGRNPTPEALRNLREDLSSTLRNLLIDQSEFAVLEPSARTRQTLLRGSRPGTIWGEIARCFAQFKSFPVTYIQRVLGAEVYGRGYKSLGAYIQGGNVSHFGAMLGLMVSLTASGYLAMTAKDLLKLREPKPVDDPKTWGAALMQGGALGIYGDFLFGQYNRAGKGAIETLAGPVGGAISDLYAAVNATRESVTSGGEDVEPADAAAKWVRLAQSNTPFLNLHLVKPTLDALFWWRLQEALNPGSLARMERKVKKDQGQKFFLRPSELVR